MSEMIDGRAAAPAQREWREAALFVNGHSRRGREWYESAKEKLDQLGVPLKRAELVRQPSQLPGMVSAAISAGTDLIIVGGGDGTLSAAAQKLAGTNTILGLLPFGTGNEFARDLTIRTDVQAACETIAAGRVQKIDVGTINDQVFINVATVGLSTLIAKELTEDAKRAYGRFVYVFALLRALRRIRPFQVTLESVDGTQCIEALQVVIGNGKYHAGPFPIAPNASITDGKLIVYAVGGTNKWELLRFAARLPGGQHVRLPEVTDLCVSAGTLKTSPPQQITIDGEVGGSTPVRFGIRPGALRVLVPVDFKA